MAEARNIIKDIRTEGEKGSREIDDAVQKVNQADLRRQKDEHQSWERDVFEDCDLDALEQFENLINEEIQENRIRSGCTEIWAAKIRR